jgi:hypothetical protein
VILPLYIPLRALWPTGRPLLASSIQQRLSTKTEILVRKELGTWCFGQDPAVAKIKTD